MVRFPTQMGLNWFGVTKVVKSLPVICMGAEPEQIQPEQSPKRKTSRFSFWFYFSKDFANESEKNLKEMELYRKWELQLQTASSIL